MAKAAALPKRPTDALVQAHEAHSSIRAQGKRAAALPPNAMAGTNKDVVKAVLASPLIIPWPQLPTHLQNTVMRTLASMIPTSVADYHISRERCHRSHKRKERRQQRASARDGEDGSPDPTGAKRTAIVKATPAPDTKPTLQKTTEHVAMDTSETSGDRSSLVRPDELRDLTIGITEITKHLEAQTAALRLRIQSMVPSPLPSHLLPTAPVREPSPGPDSENPFLPTAAQRSPLRFVVCPLSDINPPTLVAHIPQYCATYNALVRQWTEIAKTQSPEGGSAPEEVTLVTTAKGSEKVIAELVGLRRVACLGVTTTFPDLSQTLIKLLPSSVLVPPRHVFALPMPGVDVPAPTATYIPLHLKAVQTTVPANAKEKKLARLEAVRAKRKSKHAQETMTKKKRTSGKL